MRKYLLIQIFKFFSSRVAPSPRSEQRSAPAQDGKTVMQNDATSTVWQPPVGQQTSLNGSGDTFP